MSESAIDTISKVTGLSRGSMDTIWEKVKANQALLKACPGHDFSIPARTVGAWVRDWKCSRCGGTVEMSAKHWYELGLKHGRPASRP